MNEFFNNVRHELETITFYELQKFVRKEEINENKKTYRWQPVSENVYTVKLNNHFSINNTTRVSVTLRLDLSSKKLDVVHFELLRNASKFNMDLVDVYPGDEVSLTRSVMFLDYQCQMCKLWALDKDDTGACMKLQITTRKDFICAHYVPFNDYGATPRHCPNYLEGEK